MSDDNHEKKHPTIAAMDAPQEEFIEPEAVPSQPEDSQNAKQDDKESAP